jgi:type II secretory pathway predicted ATPase ExeA
MSVAEPLPIDPFCSAADPSGYVPRAATEAALAELRVALEAGPGAIALTGPIGIGKTLLTRVLEAQLSSSYTFVCLQATPPSLDQVCEAALHALGDAPPRDACGALALRAALLARRGRPLVLVLDAAEALPPSRLAELSELPLHELRLVLVASHSEGLVAALGAFGPELRRVALDAPLSRAENEEYLAARLERADAPPELRSRVLAKGLDLWRSSRGNPQLLHAEVSQLQLDLWRSTAAEPRLRIVEEEPPTPGATVPGELQDLEIDADVAPVPAEPLPTPPAASVAFETAAKPSRLEERPAAPPRPEPPPREPAAVSAEPSRAETGPTRPASRAWTFALGALCGAVAAALAMHWLQSQREPEAHVARPSAAAPVRSEPVEAAPLPPVAAAPTGPPREPAPLAEDPRPEPEAAAIPPEPARSESGPTPPPAARTGSVRVQVQALPWATIYIDGELVGETPLGDLPVDAGMREFRAEMPDGRTLRKRVSVQDGTRVLFQ